MSSSKEGDNLLGKNQAHAGRETHDQNDQETPKSSILCRLPFRAAAVLLLALLSVTLFYHILILTRIVPYEKVWGGRLTSVEQMYRFETVAVVVNLCILAVALLRLIYPHNFKFLSILCWIFCTLYALNTIGNLFAKTNFERIVFTPLTLVLSVGFARLAVGEAGRSGLN